MTFRDHFETEFEDDLGNKRRISCNQRLYIPSEISWLPKSLGLSTNRNVWSKAWAVLERNQLTTQDFEMLVIANK